LSDGGPLEGQFSEWIRAKVPLLAESNVLSSIRSEI